MRKLSHSILTIIVYSVLFGCSDNAVDNTPVQTETLVLQLDGVIEEVGGDCSGVQVRTRSLGEFDLANSDKIKFTFNGMSDADLSSITIFYLHENEPVNLMHLPDRESINSTSTFITDSPQDHVELFSRVTLKSSVCTGQIFFLTFSDLKVYTIQ